MRADDLAINQILNMSSNQPLGLDKTKETITNMYHACTSKPARSTPFNSCSPHPPPQSLHPPHKKPGIVPHDIQNANGANHTIIGTPPFPLFPEDPVYNAMPDNPL